MPLYSEQPPEGDHPEYLDHDEVGDEIEPTEDADALMSESSGDEAEHAMDDSDNDAEGMDEGDQPTGGDGDDEMVEFHDDSVQGFFAHKEPVYAVAIHPRQPELVLTGGGDDRAYLWRCDTGATVFELEGGFEDSVTAVGFNVDGTLMAAGAMDGKVRVWNTSDGQVIQALDGPAEVTWLTWHPRGSILLVGSSDGTMWMWTLPSGHVMQVFTNPSADALTCGTFTPDGKTIVTGSEDGSVTVWDPKTANAVFRLTSEDARFHTDTVTSVAVSPDSSLAVTGAADGTARLIHLQNGQIVGALDGHTESVEAVGFSRVLPLIATASVDGTINLWDAQNHRLRQTIRHDDAVTKLQWHTNSPLLTTASTDRTVRLWDARTGQCERKWSGHQDAILDFALSPDGHTVVTGSDDGCSLVFAMQ
ncbi:60S ribosomal subunit assembly or modification protein [Tieghemiomyces parasiticus]|uniref:60S ribosomal subunit assembly or modification protein n=1 Tax=Tieghemiomyces parasiticus TaxID=78921 RepID=A0A9W7ZMT8_9FUNG|nr:60S ribosomal subunit assembly or modification protein [Tieghemiomyces parasiticus]